jgi:hypothetical protein
MMATTALNELIDILNQLKIESTKPDSKRTGDYRIGLGTAVTVALNLLDKERNQIRKSFESGCSTRENMNIKKVMNKINRNKIIWAEIKAKEQEYKRLSSQIEDLKLAQRDISFDIQKRIDESEKIGEWILEKEYEGLQIVEAKQTGT